ncbi:MAG: S-layer homology domain-containing protein [Clostridia bacterium]|nr:S-layer homology domain-containing protein [Clostridia bacterium]
MNIKKILAFIITIYCLVSASAYAFPDVDESTSQGKAIVRMQKEGYIQGFEDGNFRPGATLTRAEFVTIVNKIYGFTVETENIFSDINTGDWFYNAVLCGVQAGYIQGHDDLTFRPDDKVTREQVCVMMNRILNVERIPYSQSITDEVSDWARDSVEKLISNRFFILEEGGKFRATQPITRGEVCEALEKCIVDVSIDIEPIDLESIARDELEKKLTGIINDMETKVIPLYTYDVNNEIANRVLNSMKNYLKDPEYDYISDAKATYEIYRHSGKASREFKNLIYENMNVDDIAIMFDFFYTPEIDSLN